VVTALVVPELVVPDPSLPLVDVAPPLVPLDVALPLLSPVAVAVAVRVAVEVIAAVEVIRAASAGSWPETSMSVINSQVATNSERAPAITRRRIIRALISRASRTAPARPRAPTGATAASGAMGVMSVARGESIASA
jgi:DMSO reductase anchor subunit